MRPSDRLPFRGKPGPLAFSLTELLLVVALILTMMGFITTSLGLGKARNLSMAGNLVAGLCEQARQNAISRNVLSALVIGHATGSERSGRVLIILELSGNQWAPVTAWTTLPSGVSVDQQSPKYFLNQPLLAQPIELPPCGGVSVDAASCVYQIFSPAGGLLTTGVTQPQPSLIPLVQSVGDSGQNQDNYCDVIVNHYTGIAKVDRP